MLSGHLRFLPYDEREVIPSTLYPTLQRYITRKVLSC